MNPADGDTLLYGDVTRDVLDLVLDPWPRALTAWCDANSLRAPPEVVALCDAAFEGLGPGRPYVAALRAVAALTRDGWTLPALGALTASELGALVTAVDAAGDRP